MILCRNLLYLIPCSLTVFFGVAGWLIVPEKFSELEWMEQLVFVWAGAVSILLAALVPVFLFVAYVVPFLEVPRRSYAVRQEDLNYRRGFFKNVASCAPFRRIHHASTHRLLFERMFNLSTLEVFTAGGRAFRIEGLSPETAEALRDHVLEQISKYQENEQPKGDGGTPKFSGAQDMDCSH